MSEGYDHLYIVQKSLVNIGGDNGVYKVLFQCGNWCYSGNIKLNEENLVISKLTEIITNIQKQQSSLRFYCDTKNLKNELEFAVQVRFIAKSYDIFNQYITSTQVEGRFAELLETNDWLDIQNGCFFELRCNYIPQEVSDSILIIRKSYNKGLITTIAYYDDSTYVVLQPGEGDFPLLDIRYPIFASTGDNTVLLVTDDFEQGSFFDGLFVWKAFKNGPTDSNHNIKKQCVLETADLSTGTSENLYIILKERNHSNASTHRDILLRFGNWCYSGRLLITDSEISKADDAVEILRAQQSCMRFIFEASKVPAGSPFSAALEYMHKTVLPNIKLVLARSEVHIQQLVRPIEPYFVNNDSPNNFFISSLHS